MTEWCNCPTELTSGHLCLLPVADVWVHGECLLPSFPIWQAHEKYCDECGRSFSSPVSDVCVSCVNGPFSWTDLAEQYRRHLAEMLRNHRLAIAAVV